MIWIVQALAVGVLVYYMVQGYRARKERKILDRLDTEMNAKIKAGLEARRKFDEETARILKGL